MSQQAPGGKTGGVLRVLLLEDDATDAELVTRELQRAGLEPRTERVDSRQSFTHALLQFAPDVILSDHGVGPFDALAALDVARGLCPTVPLIVVAGALGHHTALACLRAGAEDVVLKDELSRLGPAIEAALAIRRPIRRLSPRQVEILRLMALGQPTREIAGRLGIGVKTVETHQAELKRRLGITSLAELVRYAVRVGLIPPEG